MLRRENQPEYQPQEDYILRLAAQLREFLARIAGHRVAGQPDQALIVAMNAQERLFGCPMSEFTTWSIEEQVAHLLEGISPAEGAEKCSLYAQVLAEAARIYETRGPAPMAAVARQFAVQVLTCAQNSLPAAHRAELAMRAGEISASLATGDGSEVGA